MKTSTLLSIIALVIYATGITMCARERFSKQEALLILIGMIISLLSDFFRIKEISEEDDNEI